MHLHGAHRYIARATGDPLHSRARMAKLDTVFSLALCYRQKGNTADKQSPRLNIDLTKVLTVLHWEEGVCVCVLVCMWGVLPWHITAPTLHQEEHDGDGRDFFPHFSPVLHLIQGRLYFNTVCLLAFSSLHCSSVSYLLFCSLCYPWNWFYLTRKAVLTQGPVIAQCVYNFILGS